MTGTVTRLPAYSNDLYFVDSMTHSWAASEDALEHAAPSGALPAFSNRPFSVAAQQTKNIWSSISEITFNDVMYDLHAPTPSADQKKKWKEEGRCEECGTLRPMSIHGLLDCPDHPTPQKGVR